MSLGSRILFSPFFELREELAEQLENLAAYLSQNPKRIENIRADPATIAHHSQQHMLGANVRASLPLCFVHLQLEHLASSGHVIDFLLHSLLSPPHFLF